MIFSSKTSACSSYHHLIQGISLWFFLFASCLLATQKRPTAQSRMLPVRWGELSWIIIPPSDLLMVSPVLQHSPGKLSALTSLFLSISEFIWKCIAQIGNLARRAQGKDGPTQIRQPDTQVDLYLSTWTCGSFSPNSSSLTVIYS